jgi:hypothetical protein
MIGKLVRGVSRRHGTRLFFALCAGSLLCAGTLSMAKVPVPGSPYFNDGLRWIGTASSCTAPPDWTAERLFRAATPPAGLGDLCLYTWTPVVPAAAPTPAQVNSLFTVSRAHEMTEDVPVVFPAAPASPEEEAVLTGFRTALRAQVGDASLLPSLPAVPAVRVVVIDSAPDASHGHIQPGANRHGDTLAHLIEDLVCQPAGGGRPGRTCAAEVTTVLALPWIAKGVVGPNGGYVGTLSDLARAIERAVSTWQNDRLTAPASTPARLLLNLSVGWEHTAGIADCSTDPPERLGPPARAVRGILQYATSQGALVVAAAGNDSGGPMPRTGLVCPGRYQSVRQDADPSQALLVAVSGVDYHDDPLETARPLGITGIVGLGLGGVAWNPGDPAPPLLTGASVAAAVVSAVGALAWTYQPSWTQRQVTTAVYNGGLDVGAADECPLLLGPCRSRRVSVCGALQAAGASPRCSPAAPKPWSGPDLRAEMAALAATNAGLPASTGTLIEPLVLGALPRYLSPAQSIDPRDPWLLISTTCRVCERVAPGPWPSHVPTLFVGPCGRVLNSAVLVVRLADGSQHGLALGPQLAINASYAFPLVPSWVVQSAYLTGFDPSGHSVTEQIVVQQ